MHLRIMVYNFIRSYYKDSFNGLKLKFIYDNEKYKTVGEYCEKNVLKMGEEAQDLVIHLLPVVMRMAIKNVMVDKNASGGFHINTNAPRTDQTTLEYKDRLNFHDDGTTFISHFFRPGHYEVLVQIEFMKQNPYFQDTFGFFTQIGYNEKGQFVDFLPRSQRNMTLPSIQNNYEFQAVLVQSASQRFTVKNETTIALHCSHVHNLNELLAYLSQSFKFDQKVESLFQTKSGSPLQPACSICGNPLSFQDINRLMPNRYKRNEYTHYLKKFKSKTAKPSLSYESNMTPLKVSKTTVSFNPYFSSKEQEKEYLLEHYKDDTLNMEGAERMRVRAARRRQCKNLYLFLLFLFIFVIFVVLMAVVLT